MRRSRPSPGPGQRISPRQPAGRSTPALDLSRRDPRLTVRLKVSPASAAAAAPEVARPARIGLVISTALGERSLRLKEGEPTVREAMVTMATITGGGWQVIGDTYVLVPNRALERAAWLDPEWKAAWLQFGLDELREGLSRRQRQELASAKRLRPGELSERQRQVLRKAAMVAYAGWPELDPRALALEDVELVSAAGVTPAGSAPPLRYRFPVVGGGTKEITALPPN